MQFRTNNNLYSKNKTNKTDKTDNIIFLANALKMWRSSNEIVDEFNPWLNPSLAGWKMFPIEHPNVAMSHLTFAEGENRDPPNLNADKAFHELTRLRDPLLSFAPVRVSEGRGR